MNVDTIYKTVDYIFTDHYKVKKNIDSENPLAITISGGEPLLQFELLKKMNSYIVEKSLSGKVEKPFIELSTNATLLTDKIVKYLIENDISLFIGFDGIEESYNKNRLYKNDDSPYQKVVKAIEICKENNYMDKTTLNLVITPNNVQYLKDNILYMNKYIGFNYNTSIAYEQNWTESTYLTLKEQIEQLLPYYIERIGTNPDYSLNLFDDVIERCINPKPYSPDNCGAGSSTVTILTDGTIIPCNSLAYASNEVLGDIGNVTEGICFERLDSFREVLDRINFSDCNGCAFKNKCYNFCIAINQMATGNMSEIPLAVCEINKILIKASETLVDRLYHKDKKVLEAKYL